MQRYVNERILHYFMKEPYWGWRELSWEPYNDIIRVGIIYRYGENQYVKHSHNCWHDYVEVNTKKVDSHYSDVIMSTMASQITSLIVVYSTVYSGLDQRKHQSSASLAFVRGIHRGRWIPCTNGQWRGKCFQLITSLWLFRKITHWDISCKLIH